MARRAYSLDTLLAQVNEAWPNRNKASDGWIGDAAHAAVKSEHNPNSAGVVTAIDITHDPANGADMNKLAAELVKSNDNRMWYIIFNKRIYEVGVGWQAYYGVNDHTKHLHISTNQSASLYDDARRWSIGAGPAQKEEEVSRPTIETLRIIHAFVAGWDIEKALRGDYDNQFNTAAGWKEVNAFVYEQFTTENAGKWRGMLIKLQKGELATEAQKDIEEIRKIISD